DPDHRPHHRRKAAAHCIDTQATIFKERVVAAQGFGMNCRLGSVRRLKGIKFGLKIVENVSASIDLLPVSNLLRRPGLVNYEDRVLSDFSTQFFPKRRRITTSISKQAADRRCFLRYQIGRVRVCIPNTDGNQSDSDSIK